DLVLKSFTSGIKENMIPRDATAIVIADDVDVEELKTEFDTFLAENGLTGEFTVDGNELKFFLIGKSAHALEPKAGLNAATFLATFLNTKMANNYLKMIAEQMHLDSRGHKLGINSIDAKMGDLTVTPDLFNYEFGKTNHVIINVRYPQSTN